MKKLILVILSLLLLAGCVNKDVKYDQPDTAVADMSGYGLDSENFHYLNLNAMFGLMDEGKTFIVVLSHVGCPWCEGLLPVMDEIIDQKGLQVYYLDSLSEEIASDTEGLDKLLDMAKEYVTYEDDKPVLWVPSVFYVQQGKIIAVHEGTVNTHPAKEREMTEKEIARLEYQLSREFDALLVRK